ncbi:putative Ig domain-containing protein [Phyllobacterium sp. YR531]|uniref:putative Ig domain-containing protein n=1 Tax=Phyllobacterium sp. YR531 TaxID=1144343 RepID=UPI00026F5B92|nr:putative Ig domain-containing protein [Phyllobacterium sp. YR531]EJN02496.1 outer membrane autotransporter barrel domain-containing protein [Phyllobacterium sp. YR531]
MYSKVFLRFYSLVMSAMLFSLGVGWSPSAFAQTCAPNETSRSFSFTGGSQSTVVPSGVSSITVHLIGAQGGDGKSGAGTIGGSPLSPGGAGGLGSRVSGRLSVSPGDVLSVGVGGRASLAVNPGGTSGSGDGGIGGGGTDLSLGGSRIAIAAGGGGGGNAGWSTANVIRGGDGGAGGALGSAGATVPGGPGPFGGGGGSPGTGGVIGAGCGSFPATPGQANGQGGRSNNFSGSFAGAGFGGGGGGGNTIGGGGGGAGVGTTGCQQNWNGGGGGGGGGLSSPGPLQSVSIVNGANSGDGSALICFATPAFVISGTASSLNGTARLELATTSPASVQTIDVPAGSASFAFTNSVPDGAGWNARVLLAPDGQVCTLVPSSGTISNADVTNLALTCTTVQVDITPETLPDGVFGQAYSQTIAASSANGGTAPYSFSLASGSIPGGLVLSSAGLLSGTPNATGSFTFTVRATDTDGFIGERQYTVAVPVPVITVAPANLPDGKASNAYGPATLSASGGAAPYTYQVVAGTLPAGLALAGDQISGTPTAAGSYTFTVRATDTNGFTGELQYTVAIEPPTIIVSPANLPGGNASNDYGSVTLTADGGTGPYSFQVSAGALPAGLNLAGAVISGTPTIAGSFNFTVTATDANGATGEQQFTIAIASPGINITPDALPDGKIPNDYSPVTLTANGGAAPYTFQISAGALPVGLNLTNAEISGKPSAAGSFTFMVRATDANGFTGERQYTIVVAAPGITIGPDAVPAGEASNLYPAVTLSADGGTAPYTYQVSTGALPAGLGLSGAEISGTPKVAGTFNFTITATDAGGFAGQRQYSLTIEAPTITVGPDVLPGGKIPEKYGPVGLTVDGGAAPYSFQVTSGALPAGLSLTDTHISGTPTAAGASNFSVTATDANGFTGTRQYKITVKDLPPPEAQNHTLSVLAGTTGTVDLTQGATGGPFSAAAIVTSPPSETGKARITKEDGTHILEFAAAGTFAGTTKLTYTLSNGARRSAPATVTITVTARPDPSRDPEVIGLIRAQTESAKRFANTQIRNFSHRLEQLHNEGEQRSNSMGLSVSVLTDSTQSEPYESQDYSQQQSSVAVARQGSGAVVVGSGAACVDDRQIGLNAQQDATPESTPITTGQSATGKRIRIGSACPETGLMAYSSDQSRKKSASDPSIEAIGKVSSPTTNGTEVAAPVENGHALGEFAFWTGGYVDFGTNDDGAIKLDNTLVGVSAGVDYRFTPKLTAGVGVGFGRDSTDVGDNGTESRAEAFSIAAYGSYRPVPGFFLDGLAGYSTMSFDSERYVTSTGDFASGKRDGDQFFAALTAGYEYRKGGLLISPYGQLSGSHSTLDAFTEKGADIYNLTYDDQDIDTLSGTFGLRLEHAIRTKWGMLTPRARLEYTHDFEGSSRASVGYADLGTLPYAFDVDAFSRDHITVGLGFDAQIGEGWNLGFDYRTAFGTDGDSQDHTFATRLGIQF